MTARVVSATAFGFEGKLIDIECDATKGLPTMQIVGMGSKAIDEAKERVRSAITNSHLDFPAKKLTVNLAPASLPKDGAHFDLPIALAILIVSGQLRPSALTDTLCAGELSLSGELRPVRGIINIVETARVAGKTTVIIPVENAAQASLVKDVEIIAARNLGDVYLHLLGEKRLTAYELPKEETTPVEYEVGLEDVFGQTQAKRALVIAAAGHHNLLLDGPPGAGKTLLARSLTSLLPPLEYEERIAATKLHSLIGDTETVIDRRPFRSPHHTSSHISLVGGGTKPMPGEISLAHTGVLFLDEIPEYPRQTLEALRQPLEDRQVNVSRASGRVTFPANFMLIATKNPCPCGFYGDASRECSCTMQQILTYQKRLSGPLLDRIDLSVTVSRVPEKDLLAHRQADHTRNETTIAQEQIARARQRQRDRYNGPESNASLSSKNIAERTRLSDEAAELLKTAAERLKVSARSFFKLIKVARTIADLDDSDTILPEHMAEALQYRQLSHDTH